MIDGKTEPLIDLVARSLVCGQSDFKWRSPSHSRSEGCGYKGDEWFLFSDASCGSYEYIARCPKCRTKTCFAVAELERE